MRIIWSDEALDDLKRLVEFLAPVSVKAADRTADLLLGGPEKLLMTPRLGERVTRLGPEEVRRIILDDYELRYEVQSDATVVLRIWHTRENR